MSMPKSVTKQTGKNGITIINNVDRCNYTINELTRAALRDVGKYVVITTNKKAQTLRGMAKNKRVRGTKHAFQYWVRKNDGNSDLQVGIKHGTWYGTKQELGEDKMPKKAFLTSSVEENIATIIRIESQYLSALEDEAIALAMISEEEYVGTEDDD